MKGQEMSLELGLIGNGKIAALIDSRAEVVWCCMPRFDADPVFCSLLAGADRELAGAFGVSLVDASSFEQAYLPNTPILVTRVSNNSGDEIEITDFCPRFERSGKLYPPPILARQVKRIAGNPLVQVSLRVSEDYGCTRREGVVHKHAVDFPGKYPLTLRTSTQPSSMDVPHPVSDSHPMSFVIGGRDAVADAPPFEQLLEETLAYWNVWSAALNLPGGFVDAVTRAAITLELNAYPETGGIIAAISTSIPEAPNTGRNWDYRYCWPRDAYFVVNALGRLGDVRTSARYLHFLLRVAEASGSSLLVPMYSLDGGPIPEEQTADCLAGFRGMGPVRIGNKASVQAQNDIYGEAILTAEPLFRARRGEEVGEDPVSARAGDRTLFARLEKFGEHAARLYDQPDAGLWELRGTTRVHTFSSMMCWAACDRLARYAEAVGLADRARYWAERAIAMHEVILKRCWNPKKKAFTAAMEGETLDASLLLIPRLRFVPATDERFVQTVEAIERELKHGDFIYRYVEQDDFGHPENAFLVCTFWYIEALAAIGGERRAQALALFNRVLAARNRHGLLAEDLDTRTLEQWGNYPQTYCMSGIIDCAITLSQTDHGIDTTRSQS
ncbi:MAG TPA: glycoside hydrolase family 15 protein [Gemmatimonadaceae bacterium]